MHLHYCNKYFLKCTFLLVKIIILYIMYIYMKCIVQTFSSVCFNSIHNTSISHFCSKPVWSTDFHFLNQRHHLHVSQSLDAPSYWLSKQWFFFQISMCKFYEYFPLPEKISKSHFVFVIFLRNQHSSVLPSPKKSRTAKLCLLRPWTR